MVQRPDVRAQLCDVPGFGAGSRLPSLAMAVGLCLLLVFSAGIAGADSIYLKNGRVIRTSTARVEGDQVLFFQHGSEQSIPLSLVDRIEKDERQEPQPTGNRGASGAGSQAAGSSGQEGGPPSNAQSGAVPGGDIEGLTNGLESLSALTNLKDQLGGMASAQAGAQNPAQALGQLQSIGADGLLPLADQLGALGNLGALAGLGGEGTDLGQLGEVVPLIRRLGELLAAPNPSPEDTMSTVQALLGGLGKMGVTSEMIQAEAQRLGIPLAGIQAPKR
jgi:hypothetical protein